MILLLSHSIGMREVATLAREGWNTEVSQKGGSLPSSVEAGQITLETGFRSWYGIIFHFPDIIVILFTKHNVSKRSS